MPATTGTLNATGALRANGATRAWGAYGALRACDTPYLRNRILCTYGARLHRRLP